MIKTSSSNSDGDKMVNAELYRVGYVKAHDRMARPNYLVHLTIQNYFILDIDVEEELNKRGNGGNLDDYGGDERNFCGTMKEVKLERSCVLLRDYGIEKYD